MSDSGRSTERKKKNKYLDVNWRWEYSSAVLWVFNGLENPELKSPDPNLKLFIPFRVQAKAIFV